MFNHDAPLPKADQVYPSRHVIVCIGLWAAHVYIQKESHRVEGASMKNIDCTTCRTYLPDLLLDRQAAPAGVSLHLADCAPCQQELRELEATWTLLDEWTAPEPSAFFDARLHARLREAQAAAPEGLWERLTSFLAYSTGRGLRPAMAGALGLVLLLGGGTAATLLTHHGTPAASPTVNDLKIFDNNAQAFQEMDLLDDAGPASTDDAPAT